MVVPARPRRPARVQAVRDFQGQDGLGALLVLGGGRRGARIDLRHVPGAAAARLLARLGRRRADSGACLLARRRCRVASMATPDPTVWAAGDYAAVAATIVDVSDRAVGAAGVEPGQAVLDVATGTGNAALAAAALGARVTGLDLTPDLLEIARRRAQAESLEIAFDQGDAQSLPYEDATFDAVVSVFGAMFAPDHARTAAELLRVCRPGG